MNCVSALPNFPTFRTLFHFLSPRLRISLRHKGSENYSQSSFLLIKYIFSSFLLSAENFLPSQPDPRWPFSKMYYFREKLLLLMKVISPEFYIKDKMVNTETGKTPGLLLSSLRAFFRPKSALNCFPLFPFPEVVTTTTSTLTSSFSRNGSCGAGHHVLLLPLTVHFPAVLQKQRALFWFNY